MGQVPLYNALPMAQRLPSTQTRRPFVGYPVVVLGAVSSLLREIIAKS
jgi:hypothetical protein